MTVAHHRLPSRKKDSRLARFRADVLRGLRSVPKELPCKYFYDEIGSDLFEQITRLEEYYLTRTELGIMERHAPDMARLLEPKCLLIEYGSGSSTKTRLLLDHLRPAAYVPVDISGKQLRRSARTLAAQYPDTDVAPLCADFTRPLSLPRLHAAASRRVVYFPGSTIGNLTACQAVDLLRQTAALVGPGGAMLLGADLQKDQKVIEAAYNDAGGVTARFNLNLLARINCELGGDLAIDQFRHYAFYNPAEGRVEIFLESLRAQRVSVDEAEFFFAPHEKIRTEYSYKYTLAQLSELANRAGFEMAHIWTDERGYFSVSLLTLPTWR